MVHNVYGSSSTFVCFFDSVDFYGINFEFLVITSINLTDKKGHWKRIQAIFTRCAFTEMKQGSNIANWISQNGLRLSLVPTSNKVNRNLSLGKLMTFVKPSIPVVMAFVHQQRNWQLPEWRQRGRNNRISTDIKSAEFVCFFSWRFIFAIKFLITNFRDKGCNYELIFVCIHFFS